MRRYSEAVKADVRRRMTPRHRQSVAASRPTGRPRTHWLPAGETPFSPKLAVGGWRALLLKRSRCLNVSAFCREAIAEKLERLEVAK